MKKAYFYGFRPKTVRSPNQKHTVSEPKPYVFGTETVEGSRPRQEHKLYAETNLSKDYSD